MNPCPRFASALRALACASAIAFTVAPGRADSPTPNVGTLPEADRRFLDHVWPILRSRCVQCHGPEKQKGDLRLDSREASLRGGEQGPSVVPGKPEASLLVQAVLHAKPALEMPPKDRLSPAEIALLDRWIRDGAPWPTPDPALASSNSVAALAADPTERLGDAWSDPRNPVVRAFHGQRLDLWSLRPLQVVTPPPLPASATTPGSPAPSVRNPIDAFILARLAEARLAPAPEAPPITLARRVAFDLTGLPPSPAEMDAFLADPSPRAYERWVDRLLASPRYGEHQARLWLDVIRYSDSNGFDWDEFRPAAWRFRDYVVRAFNADKPFDVFVREQLAGDELLAGPPRDAEEQDRLVATGYLRVGPQDNSAPLFNEQARARAEWLADLTETTGSAFLGLTLGCCRCHDHKYDPLTQADHFRLRAFFEPVKYGDDLALDLAPDQDAIRRQHAEVDQAIAPKSRERDTLVDTARHRVRLERIAKLPAEDQRLLAQTTDPQPQDFKEKAAAVARRVRVSDDDARKAFTPEEKEQHAALQHTIEALAKTKRPFLRGLLATDAPGQVPATHVLFQGDPKAERDVVPPGFLSILDPNPAAIVTNRNPVTTGRRSTLADWITSPNHPLTARVFVNRVWQSLFGRGLVGTPNDFGLAGARPTHPALLDWLAGEFVRQGWSVKRLHRLVVTSATYRQSTTPASGVGDVAAAVDADNTLLWRQNLRRLSAEQLRDAYLAVAGTLRECAGGPPVWPELPPEILQANPAFLDDNAEKTKGWYPSPAEQRSVRSLYLVQKRTVRVPFLETFDLPENSTSCPRRNESIVAPQALALLNGQEPLIAARSLADRVRHEAGGAPVDQVRRLFVLALQRAPDAPELDRCLHFLGSRGLPELARALLNLNEFAYLD